MSSYLLLVLYCMCPGVEFCKKKKKTTTILETDFYHSGLYLHRKG